MTTPVRIDDAALAEIQRRFREGRPSQSSKRKRHSRYDVTLSLYTEIEKLLAEGYSYDGIAEYLGSLDVVIPVTTLKNYVGRARRRLGSSRTSATSPLGENDPIRRLPKKSRATTATQPSRKPPNPAIGAERSAVTRARDTADATAHAAPNEERESWQAPTGTRGLPDGYSAEAPRLAPHDNDSAPPPPPAALPAPSDMPPATATSSNALTPSHSPATHTMTTAPASQAVAPREDSSSMAALSADELPPGSREESNAPGIAEVADLGTRRLATLRAHSSPIKNAFTPRPLRLDKDL